LIIEATPNHQASKLEKNSARQEASCGWRKAASSIFRSSVKSSHYIPYGFETSNKRSSFEHPLLFIGKSVELLITAAD